MCIEKCFSHADVKIEMDKKILGQDFRTDRGLQTVPFKDRNGQECSLQQSSLADASAIWLGPKGHRMHLDRYRVVALIIVLEQWINKGEFL